MIEADRNDRPPDAGAASERNDRTSQAADRHEGRGGGLYVTVSRQRLDYGRALIGASSNSNSPPVWTPARIAGIGEFRAAARLSSTPCDSTANIAAFRVPVRPGTAAAESGADVGSDSTTDELSGLMEAIAQEVQGQAAVVCAGIASDFATKIMHARKSLPRDQVAVAVTALRQAKKAAVRFVRESAALEIAGRQKQAQVIFQRRRVRLVAIERKVLDYEPGV